MISLPMSIVNDIIVSDLMLNISYQKKEKISVMVNYRNQDSLNVFLFISFPLVN